MRIESQAWPGLFPPALSYIAYCRNGGHGKLISHKLTRCCQKLPANTNESCEMCIHRIKHTTKSGTGLKNRLRCGTQIQNNRIKVTFSTIMIFITSWETIIRLIILNEEANESVTKQIRGCRGFTSLQTEKELPLVQQDITTMSHLQLHIKTSLCPCQSYQCVITTYLRFITYLAYPIRPKRPSPHV